MTASYLESCQNTASIWRSWRSTKAPYDGSEIRRTHELRLVVYPIIYRVLLNHSRWFSPWISEPSIVWLHVSRRQQSQQNFQELFLKCWWSKRLKTGTFKRQTKTRMQYNKSCKTQPWNRSILPLSYCLAIYHCPKIKHIRTPWTQQVYDSGCFPPFGTCYSLRLTSHNEIHLNGCRFEKKILWLNSWDGF